MPSGVTRVGVTRVSNWRCHTYFCPKNLETFFVITCQFYSVTPICFLVKNWRPFSSSLSLLLISVGCHPATVLPVRPCSSTILCKFSHNFFSIQVSPPWGVSPGVVCPSPQWCHCLCLLCTVCRWKCVLVMNLWPACVQHRNLLMSLWSPSFLSSWLHFPENFILLCIFSDSCIQITCNQSASGAVQVLDPLLYRLCTFISTAGASLHETVLDLSMQLAALFFVVAFTSRHALFQWSFTLQLPSCRLNYSIVHFTLISSHVYSWCHEAGNGHRGNGDIADTTADDFNREGESASIIALFTPWNYMTAVDAVNVYNPLTSYSRVIKTYHCWFLVIQCPISVPRTTFSFVKMAEQSTHTLQSYNYAVYLH